MKIAVVGSRNLTDIIISKYIPEGTTEIITGGAKGIDTLAEKYADKNNITKTVIKPEYEKYGIHAPLVRNKEIVEKADLIIAIWDGKSKGTKSTIDYAMKLNKKIDLYIVKI